MIVGKGLIGKNCSSIDREDVLFFASGVSNSTCTDENEYEREIKLLEKYLNSDKKIIYFSSIDEYIINERYLTHKKKIEKIIESNTDNFIIMKIPQLIGKNGNSKNFIFNISENIKKNLSFDLYITKRSLLDVSDMVKILNHLLENNYKGFFNINYIELMDVSEIIKIVENILNKKSIINKSVLIDQKINKNCEFVESVIYKIIGDVSLYNLKVIKKYI